MATIDGMAQKRVILTANTETVVSFSPLVQKLSFSTDGGKAYFKTDSTITGIDDMTANYIDDGESFDLYKAAAISELHLYSTAAATVQWDIP